MSYRLTVILRLSQRDGTLTLLDEISILLMATGNKLIRLVKKGNHYEPATYPGRRDTIKELGDTLERVCPLWKDSYDFEEDSYDFEEDSYDFEEDFKTLKFATPDILYALETTSPIVFSDIL
ncbi:hypothetical protein FOL46_001277, partial [Perkinsus olseni]